jgi:polyisoprenoid-binding protein YceI
MSLNRRGYLCLTIAIITMAIMPAAGNAGTDAVVEFDPGQTVVRFTLEDVLHTVHGTFKLKRGTIRFDSTTGKASGELVVDATSGNSGSEGRDRRMHKNILESDRYPEISFVPDRIDGTVVAGVVSHVQVHGIFRIHGTDHELSLPVEAIAGSDGTTAKIHFAVPYVSWGMKNPSTLFLRVSDTVAIDIEAKAHTVLEGGQATTPTR